MSAAATTAVLAAFWRDDFAPLEAAGKAVTKALREDEAAPDADLYRRIVSSGAGSHMYYGTETDVAASVAHTKSVPMPPFLAQQLQSTRISSLMGLLPEANLAWMSVDDKLYLWSFQQQVGMDDFCSFIVPSGQCVVTVGLVRPKKGVFSSVVDWCLVVATPEEAILCALAKVDNTFRLVPTRYTIPTDKVPILSICGTPNGRIFLGGYNGSLYEMAYDSFLAHPHLQSMEEKWNAYYDGTKPMPKIDSTSIASKVCQKGKRTLSAIMAPDGRSQKCRKLNHSSTPMSTLVTSVVPEFLVKATSSVSTSVRTTLFGSNNSSSPGPVIQIVHDTERSAMYTLSSKGIVAVYDLRKSGVHQTALMNTEKIARSYLGAVSRGHMYPPGGGSIAFPGGGSSAQAGVGGMDGARSILKLADSGMRRRNEKGKEASILTPTSIHVIPRRESGRLTLMAITAGGLRYYLSSLTTSVLNSGPNTGYHKGDPLAPSRNMTLCYIRAPPPTDAGAAIPGSDSDGIAPALSVKSNAPVRIDAGHYKDGVTFLAMQHMEGGTNGTVGDVIVAATADAIARKKIKKEGQQQVIMEVPGGVSETLSLPMSSASASSGILPGGRIMSACSIHVPTRSIMKLMLNSQTPTDGELAVGLFPAYVPQSKYQSHAKKTGVSTATHSSLEVATAGTGAIVRANGTQASASSIAMTILSNFLLSRPLRHGLAYQHTLSQTGAGKTTQPLYRISARAGCGGFSPTAGGKVVSKSGGSQVSIGTASSSKSARLSPWLLRPAVVPLNQFTLDHLTASPDILALNAGGMHFFKGRSVLTSLAEALMRSGSDIGRDEGISKYFTSYGYKQGCCMCLTLAAGCGPAAGSGPYSDELRLRACQAALSRAYVPRLVYKAPENSTSGDTIIASVASDPAVPNGYEFLPSSLFDGLTSLVSRLLRPVWYKPAVVVTEGQTVKASAASPEIRLPAKVELLLDEETLEEILRPLVSLQNLMKNIFKPAVKVIPGIQKADDNGMEVDVGQDLMVTDTMMYQGHLRNQNMAASGQISPRDAETIAHLVEERNIHCLFRLLSRSVQLWSLLSNLKRAQYMPDLPEVEWGLLHGLTMAQLVESRDGQERVEALLNSLVCSQKTATTTAVTPGADADQLANQLASQCYLYFSPASRFAYLGFRAATEALSCPPGSHRRAALASHASLHLKRAANYWHSAPLITGQILHGGEGQSYAEKATRAMRHDSPLAKAAAVLLQLGDVVAMVDVCLTTASNFSATKRKNPELGDNDTLNEMFGWERGLYHKRKDQSAYATQSAASSSGSPSSPTALVVGANVTEQDAVSTCYAILLCHLDTLLNSPETVLADKMVSACAASTDTAFLKAMFKHLMQANHVETLLRIDSKELEKWLKSPEVDQEWLYRYYVVQGKHEQAGQLMWTRASQTTREMSLDARLDFLTNSLNSFNSAVEIVSQGATGGQMSREELSRAIVQVRETLDIGLLQRRVLQAVMSTPLESKLEAEQVTKLKSVLVPVSELYNDYAAPLNLFDICLLILHSCRQNEVATIATLWKSVLCEEILPCSTRNPAAYNFLSSLVASSSLQEQVVLLAENVSSGGAPLFENGDWIERLRQRVVSLGKALFGHGADYACPVDLLAASLEGLRLVAPTASMGPWPLTTLVEIGIPFPTLLSAYEAIGEQDEKELMGGVDPQTRFQHLRSLVELLEAWLVKATSGGQEVAFRQLSSAISTGMLNSKMDAMKADLEELSRVGDTDDVKRVYQRLRTVEDNMGRIA